MHVSKGWMGLAVLLLAAQMVGCGSVLDALPGAGGKKSGVGSGTNNLAPERPIGTLTGVAKDALIQGATVNVYTWTGSKGELLASGVTDENGRYSLQLQVRSQSLLLEATGGKYVEEATDTPIDVAEGETLLALQNYTRGQSLEIAITYYTTLATGLAENLVRLGMQPPDAVEESNRRLSEILGLDTIKVMPTDIGRPDRLSAAILQYGFATAAVSSLTERASIMNGREPHSLFTSIKFIQAAYDDVRADGVLNGRGVNGDVAFGRVRLDAEVYRHELALHILRIADNERANRTGLGPMQVFDLAQRLNGSTDPIFGGAPVIPLNRDKPNVSALIAEEFPNLTNGSVVFGGLNLTAMVMAFPGAASAELILDGNRVIGSASDPDNPVVPLDTFRFPIADGPHTLQLRVTDISNAVGESLLLNVNVSNRQTAIENIDIQGQRINGQFVGKSVMVTADIVDPAGVDDVQYSVKAGNGAFVPLTRPTFAAGETMLRSTGTFSPLPGMMPPGTTFPDGDARFKVDVTNSAGFTFSREEPFTIDLVPPSVRIASPIVLTNDLNDLQGRYYDGNMPCTPLNPVNPDDRCVLHARRNFALVAEVNDNHAIGTVALTVDAVPVGQSVIPSGVSTSVTPTFSIDPRTFVPPGGGSPDGPRTLMIEAIDKAGNTSANPSTRVGSQQVVFDTIKPTADVPRVDVQADGGSLPPAGGRPQQVSGTLEISGVVNDDFGVAAASLTLSGPGGTQTLDSQMNGDESLALMRRNFPSRPLTDGRYSLTLNGIDRAGNVMDPKSSEVDVDNTGPTVTVADLREENPNCLIFGTVADANLDVTRPLLQSVSLTIRGDSRPAPDNPRNGSEAQPIPVTVAQDGSFRARVVLANREGGDQRSNVTLTLVATDLLGNARTNIYEFTGRVDRNNDSDAFCVPGLNSIP